MYTYDETHNFIEIRGRGLKIITFPALEMTSVTKKILIMESCFARREVSPF